MSLAEPLRRWQELPGAVRGGAYLLLNAVFLTGLSYCIRIAGQTLPAFEVILGRNVFMTAALLPFAMRYRAFSTHRPGLHLARGLLSFLSMTTFYWSFINLPLAESTALMYTMPLFIIVLSALFTGEKVGWRRTTATVVGFLGVILMLAPGMTGVQLALLVPLSIGLIDGTITLVIKRLARTETVFSIIVIMCVIALSLSCITVAYGTFISEDPTIIRLARWRDPTWSEVGLLAILAATSGVAQVFNIMGWRAGDASALAPFAYSQIVFAGIVGFMFFGEVPAVSAAFGAAVIAGSAIYIARREAKLAKRKP